MKSRRLLNGLILAFLVLAALPVGGAPVAAGPDKAADKIEPLVLQELAGKGQTDFFVWMVEKADLSPAKDLATKGEKGQFVFDALRAMADRSQKDLRGTLDAQGVTYQSFYIVNRILVKGGSEALLRDLAARADVAQITANHTFQLEEPMINPNPPAKTQAVEPNISFVKAPEVWALGYTGQGTVVAGNDTGLDETHPAIAPHYRGCLDPPSCTSWDHNYNWWDATGTYPSDPYDGHGHGTHTTGTMVGDDGAGNQVGMAPGAQTVHCKNMDNGGGGQDSWFLTCFEWDLAPWDLTGADPRTDLAPDAINNSWGYWGGGQNQFRTAVDNLLAAGIVVEVSAGNEGSGCQSLRSPGDYQEVFTTGSVNHAGGVLPGTLTGFSSRGPSSLDGNYFPDFMAPGENIRSSVPGGGYAGGWSGTSMSGPHVTALIGLLWSANPALRGQIDTTYSIIQQTVTPLTGQGGSNCGGDYNVGPNNDWGYGTIDAYAAALLAISYGGSGALEGTVTDAVTGLPVEGATVQAVRDEGGSWTDLTDANGFYQITVAAGTFTVTASHPQYMAETATGVVVAEDGTTVQDFSLTPRGWAYGTVTDYDNGTGIAGATVTAEDGSFATTDADGDYELWLDPGAHTLTASAQDYAPESAAVTIVSGQGTQQDFALQAAVVFMPSPLEVSVPLGSTLTEPATILNRQPWDYAFEFQEKNGGYIPLLKGEPVTVKVPAGPASAPDKTAVAAGPYQARPAGTVTVERGLRPGGINEASVLLVAADDDNSGYSPIQQMLLAYGDLGAVDLYDPRSATPTLPELQAYNVVVVWANYTFADANGIGNVLADYVDAGGKVIDLNFALDPNWGYQGRFRSEGYSAMTVSGTSYASSCLGSYDPGHPIMDGITDVCDTYRGYSTMLTAGSYEVARWQDNELFVAAKDDQTVATINGYVGVYYLWTGQMADVLHNAINWLAVPADVPWLAEDPVSGTVPADSSLGVNILFDASPAAGVTQPGTYLATLTVKGEPKVPVPVVMTVEAPASWGRIEGTVTGLGYCDANPGVLEEAQVVITGSSGASWTLLTDAAGHYATWLDSAENPLTIDVTFPEHLAGQATGVMIIAGGNVVVNFGLRWDKPCLSIDTASMAVTLDLGASEIVPFTLTNVGAGQGTFENSDLDKGYVPKRQGFLPAAKRPAIPDKGQTSIGRAPNAPTASPAAIGKAIAQMVGEPAYAVDVYPGYNLVTFTNDNPGAWTVVAGLPGNQYFAGDFIGGDFSTLYVIDYATNSLYTVDTTSGAVTMIGASIPYGGETWTGMSGAVDGTMYASSTNISRSTLYTVDLGTGAVTVVGEITNAPAIIDIAATPDGSMYGVDIVGDNLIQIDPTTGAGTVIGYIGFGANYAQGMDYEEESGTLYLAAYGTQGELRIADPATGNTVLVGAFPGGAEVDSLAFATGGGGDAPWLTENPVSGTVAPDGGQQVIEVTFDAGMVTLPGTYTAEVKVKTNDPVNKSFAIDATMVVNAPADWGQLSGTVMGLGYCDADPAPLGGAQVCIEGGLCMETEADGTYLTWLEEGTYNVTVTADGHTTGYATVAIVGGQMTVQDFNLRWLQPCMSEEPASLEVTLDLGQTATEQVTLTNDGAAEGTFEASDSDKGYLPKIEQAPVVPVGVPVKPQGASSDAKVQPFQSRIDANPILHITTTDTSQSVERALNELGYAYDLYYDGSGDWTGIDFGPYDTVIVGMDGGTISQASIQKVRTDVIDQGKKLIFLGGTCWQDFAMGVNSYLVLNDTGNYCWQISNTPHWTLVDPGHPLADGLPDSYNWTNSSAAYYQIRVNDPDIEPVAANGDGYTSFFRKSTDGNFIWFIDSVYSSYWSNQADFDVLKQLISNSIEVTGGGDALWLSENPTSGTVAPDGGTAVIDVTFDASVVTQPGTYLAEITIKTSDPVNKKFVVPATMNVNGPPDWGRVEGTVQSLGACDQNPAPLEGATVEIVGFTTLTTDANGQYSTWLPQGAYTINVTAAGHAGATATVVIVAQQTTVQDFGLRVLAPCVSVTPLTLEAWLAPDSMETQTLSLINTGAGDASFKITEMLAGLGLQSKKAAKSASSKAAPQGNPPALTASSPAGPLGVPAPSAHPEAVLWDQPLSSANQAAYVNQEFTDYPEYSSFLADDFINTEPWDISTIFVPGDGWNGFSSLMNADSLTWQIYADNGGVPDGDPISGGAVWSITLPPTDPQVTISTGTPGGYPSNATLNLATPVSVPDGQWWLVFYPTMGFGCCGQFGRQPADTANGYTGQFNNPGGGFGYGTGWQPWTVIGPTQQDIAFRLEGEVANVDIPWLSEDPTQGTVLADTTVDVAVTFDATGLGIGDYAGTLRVKTGDPNNPNVNVPVTLHVVEAGEMLHLNKMKQRAADAHQPGWYRVTTWVRINDQDQQRAAGATVYGTWTLPDGATADQMNVTNYRGLAGYKVVEPMTGDYTFCMTDIVKAGYAYDPGANEWPTCMTITVMP